MKCIYCDKEATLDEIVPADFIAIVAGGGKLPQYSVHRRCDRPTIDSVPCFTLPRIYTLDSVETFGYNKQERDPLEELNEEKSDDRQSR